MKRETKLIAARFKNAQIKCIKTELICAALRASDDDFPISYIELEIKRIKELYTCNR